MGERLSINIALILIAIFTCFGTAFANGAAFNPNIGGAEIFVTNKQHENNFIVEEEVLMDGPKGKVNVTYKITNPDKKLITLPIAFPVEVLSCDIFSEGKLKDFTFKVTLNKEIIPSATKSLVFS